MTETKIAVITGTITAFKAHVREIYNSLPPGKSLVETLGFITIEHPVGIGRKYYPVQEPIDLQGRTFDEVEKSHDYQRLDNFSELYSSAMSRICSA